MMRTCKYKILGICLNTRLQGYVVKDNKYAVWKLPMWVDTTNGLIFKLKENDFPIVMDSQGAALITYFTKGFEV